MTRRRGGTMSEDLKKELARDLGFYDTVQKEGWGGIKAKDAGNMVKRAIQIAEQAAAKQYQAQQQAAQVQAPPAQSYRPTPQPNASGQSYAAAQPNPGAAASTVPPYMQQAMANARQQSPHMFQ